MSFDTLEKSAASGRPIDLYKFEGSFNTYRYTNYVDDITNSEGTYEAIPIERSRLETGTQENDVNLDISLPFDNPMVEAYMRVNTPPKLKMELWRVHPDNFNDTLLLWTGEVISWSVEKRVAKLRVPSLFGYLLTQALPRPKYQAPCNHVLYDEFCGVNPASFSHTTTVSTISGNTITIAANPFADGLCNAGEMIIGLERRMIISNTGTTFTVSSAFADAAVSDAVTIRQGCNRSFTQCKAKFSNGINFGGFPYVPDRNPFNSSL